MNRNKIVALLAACFLLCIATVSIAAEKSRLDVIVERGHILVGTTGDHLGAVVAEGDGGHFAFVAGKIP